MDSHQKPPTIQSARLILRTLDPSNNHVAFSILNDPENLRYTSFLPPTTLTNTVQWIERISQDPKSFYYSICLSQADHLPSAIIGFCGGVRTPEFSYIIDHRFAGQGYATEALAAVTSAYWRTCYPDLEAASDKAELVAIIDFGNEASKRVAQKVGFEYVRSEKEKREDGKVFDVEVWHLKPPSTSGD